jgi:hypothetical protein
LIEIEIRKNKSSIKLAFEAVNNEIYVDIRWNINQIRYVKMIKFHHEALIDWDSKNRSSVRFVLRSNMLSSTDLCVHWSVLIHLYNDDTIQVSILYEFNLLIELSTRFHCYLMCDLYKCVNHMTHVNLMRSGYLSIYLIDKIFCSHNIISRIIAWIIFCIFWFDRSRCVRMMVLKQSKRRRALFRRRKFDVLIRSI